MNAEFDDFFQVAFGKNHDSEFEPFDYQSRLAEDPECKSRLINIPTGCGKTAITSSKLTARPKLFQQAVVFGMRSYIKTSKPYRRGRLPQRDNNYRSGRSRLCRPF
jgi:hypothetical protein